MNLVLANHTYQHHMTNEGNQLQLALDSSGWKLVGPGYEGNLRDVRRILHHYQPERVFVQDVRDWNPSSGCPGATKETNFHAIHTLGQREGDYKVFTVVKDAGPDGTKYQWDFCEEIDADAIVLYYHPLSCMKYSPWLTDYKLVRTYHTIDAEEIPAFTPGRQRQSLCGSGAILAEVYPLRKRVAPRAHEFGMVWLKHPGYLNTKGPDTPRYLSFLNQFKVHFATASAYGFSLRKIIESVACGCTVVTDLPKYDVLPEIDRALVRIPPTITDRELKEVFSEAVALWDEEGRRKWADKAIRYYNYRSMGYRLSNDLCRV